MRTVLVCFLAALAVSANVPKPFKGQQSYVYRFDTQVSSSLIGTTASEIQQQAATRLRADVHISFTNDRHAKIQLQHVRLGELNAELPKSQRVQPLEHFEHREIPMEMKKQLELPMSVSYVDGVIERINFDESDVHYSKNIKRAVLNMIQLNLKRNDVQGLKMMSSMPEQDKDRNTPVFHIPEITLEGECETVYTVQKERPNEEPQDERSTFNVTKTINFSKCQRTADVTYGYQTNPSQELRCLNCLRQHKPQLDAQTIENIRYTSCQYECQPNKVNDDNDVERSTFARYELQGKLDRYVIRRASILSQYIVKAQNPASQNAVTQVIALSELTFKEQTDGDKLVSSFKQSSTDETIMYSPEWDVMEKRFYMAGDEEFEKNSPFQRVPKKEQKVAHAMRSMLKQWSTAKKTQGYEMDTAMHFNRLVQLIRESSLQEIRKIEDSVRSGSQQNDEQCWCERCDDRKCQEHARAVFIDALAVAATRNSLYVLAEKIMKGDLSQPKAVQALQIFVANQHSPSEQQANILERIVKHEVAHRSPVLKQTALLSFGTAVGAICQDKPAQGQKETFRVEELCTRGKKEQYKKTLTQLWRDASSTYERILVLKAIGNAALDNTITELQEIVTEKRQPTLIRMEAIDAMRRLRTSRPVNIRQTLMPIFQNQREQPEIRMAAFSMLLYTHPEKATLDQLTFTVLNDRSQNVKSFVLTALESLSRSPSSAEQEVSNYLKAALKMVKVDADELRASRKYRVPIYVSEKENTEEQNIFFALASIVSPGNMIPVHMSASLRSALNGEATENNVEILFSQKNLEQFYRKISDMYHDYQNEDQDREQNEQNDESERRSAKDLRSIYSSLGIKSRRSGSYFLSDEQSEETDMERSGRNSQQQQQMRGSNQPFGMLVLRTSDVDVAVIPMSEETMPRVVRKMLVEQQQPSMSDWEELSRQLTSGRIEKHLAVTLGEKKTKIPTTSGLPLALMRQVTAVGSFEAQLQTRMESSGMSSGRGLEAHLKLHASQVVTHLHEAEVWTPVLTSGVKTLRTVEFNTPIELKLRADRQKLEITMTPPRDEKVRFFGMHTLPMTFTRQADMETQTKREARVKSIHNWALEHAQREYRGDEQRDRAIVIDGHYHQLRNPKQMLQALYTTENNVHFYLNAEHAPREIMMRVSGRAFEKHSQHSRPEFDNFYSQSSRNKGFSSIYEEDDERMESDRDEDRNNKLSTYNSQYNDEQGFKHEMKLEAEAKYPSHTARAIAEIKGSCDRRMKHCKIFVDAERSPMRAFNENQPWQMNAKIQTIAPEIVRGEEDPSQKQSRMMVRMDANWGSDDKNEMNVRLQAEPTKKTMWKSNSADKWSRFLNKLDMVAEYKLRPATKHLMQSVYEMIKARMFWQLSAEPRRGEENVVRATVVVDPFTRRHANVTVQTPQERLRAEGVELPTAVLAASYFPLERRPTNYQSITHVMRDYSGVEKAECRADDRRVRTFDGVSYRAPLSECWTVLAKDCSREQPRFVVLMKKANNDEKRVKIITQDSTIELSRASDNEKTQVKIDGQRVQEQERLSEQGIELNYDRVYVNKRGINVEFDGEEVKVQLDGEYKNIQCGLCGHHNDEQDDEFRMSNNQRSSNLKEFHRSYALKNEECDESRLNKFYSQKNDDDFDMDGERQREQSRRSYRQQGNRRSSWFENDDDEDEQNSERRNGEEDWMRSDDQTDLQNIQPVERTEVIEYSHKICFSTEPVKRCPRGTTPDEEAKTQSKKAQFFCLDRTSVEGRRLQRQARRGEQIDNEGRAPSFVETLEQPTKCIAY